MTLDVTPQPGEAAPEESLTESACHRENIDTPQSILHSDLSRISGLSRLLLSGESLNDFNRKVFRLIAQRSNELADRFEQEGFELDQDVILACAELREWFLFAVQSQNYCSPAHERENAVYQGGIVEVSKFVKYLRSEINTPFLGEAYDRNVVLIRSRASESYAEFAAGYAVFAPKKRIAECQSIPALEDFISNEENRGCMLLVNIGSENAGEIVPDVTSFLSSPAASTFRCGLYLRVDGAIDPAAREDLRKAFAESGSQMQIILEEDFDPFATGSRAMRRVTFIHDQREPARYQLIQDSASMGFRPSLDDVTRYHFEAGRLDSILNTRIKTEDSIVVNHREEKVQDQDLEERNRDYAALLGSVEAVRETLSGFRPTTPFQRGIFEETAAELDHVSASLCSVLEEPSVTVSDVAETFHRCYYRLRTLVQYGARLCMPANVADLEEAMGSWEGGRVLATNSGMTAARAPIEELGSAEEVFSTDHYWESAFLTENLFGRNPHYGDIQESSPSRLEMIPHDASIEDLEKVAAGIAESNRQCPHGQLICADASISPFFYTHSFPLQDFAKALAKHGGEFSNPVYLVVDNTLDFDTINAGSLFPGGIPRNLFLIFTPSQAKLHQLGFDAVTGGLIEIHANEGQAEEAALLRERFRQKLEAEGSRQSPYALTVLNETFFSRYGSGTMQEYVDYMIGKRRRNTRAMVAHIAGVLGTFAENPAEGAFNVLDPRSHLRQITVVDREGREHQVEMSFHFDPSSCIHAYLKILEAPTTDYVAGPVFEEIKRRVFKLAAAQGIHLADGTSWGFPISRMDWYMHTMRLATGLEHSRNLAALGTIFGSVLKECLLYPDDFLKPVEVAPMSREVVRDREEELLALDRLIPQTHPTPIDCYLEEHPGRSDYSFIVENQGEMAAMLLACLRGSDSGRYVYLSKTATSPGCRGKGYFRRMFEHLKDRAAADGIDRIVLQTSASGKNEYVVKAYEKCGFAVRSIRCTFEGEWPLILVEMEAPTSGALPVSDHFEPVPDVVYEEMHESRNLEALERFCGERGLELRLSAA